MKHKTKSEQETDNITRYAIGKTELTLESKYAYAAKQIRKLSVTHHKLMEFECNGCTRDKLDCESWPAYDKAREIQMKWVETREKQIEKLIEKHAAVLHLKVRFEGDPRGCTVRLFNPADHAKILPIWAEHGDSSSLGYGVDCWL
jgi:hypothetical protein